METAGRKIVGIGETVLDIVFRNGQPQAAVPGGSVFNAMVSLGRTVGRMQPGVQLVMASQMGNDAAPDLIEENIALSDIVRGSDEDIDALYGSPDAERVYREHISRLCPRFICTRGAQPAFVFSPGVQESFPVPVLERVVSTIGAGDNFNAGIVCALVRGDFTRERLERLSAADWQRLVPTAMRFSAAVCGSLQNYVPEEFSL